LPDDRHVCARDSDGRLHFWNVATGSKAFTTLTSQLQQIALFRFSKSNQNVVVAYANDKVEIIDLHSGVRLKVLDGVPSTISQIDYLAKDRFLLIRGERLGVWDTARGKPLHSSDEHNGAIARVDFSAQGSFAASLDASGGFTVWSMRNKRRICLSKWQQS